MELLLAQTVLATYYLVLGILFVYGVHRLLLVALYYRNRSSLAGKGAEPEECFFWATHAGAELDLLIIRGGRRRGFEIKRTTAPKTSRSLWASRNTLELDKIDIIHAGDSTFPLSDGIRAVAFKRLRVDMKPLNQS